MESIKTLRGLPFHKQVLEAQYSCADLNTFVPIPLFFPLLSHHIIVFICPKKNYKKTYINLFFRFSSLTCWVHFICAPTLERNEETSVCTKKKPKLKFNGPIFLHSFVRNTEFKTMLKNFFCLFFHLRYLKTLTMASVFPIETPEEFCCHTFFVR